MERSATSRCGGHRPPGARRRRGGAVRRPDHGRRTPRGRRDAVPLSRRRLQLAGRRRRRRGRRVSRSRSAVHPPGRPAIRRGALSPADPPAACHRRRCPSRRPEVPVAQTRVRRAGRGIPCLSAHLDRREHSRARRAPAGTERRDQPAEPRGDLRALSRDPTAPAERADGSDHGHRPRRLRRRARSARHARTGHEGEPLPEVLRPASSAASVRGGVALRQGRYGPRLRLSAASDCPSRVSRDAHPAGYLSHPPRQLAETSRAAGALLDRLHHDDHLWDARRRFANRVRLDRGHGDRGRAAARRDRPEAPVLRRARTSRSLARLCPEHHRHGQRAARSAGTRRVTDDLARVDRLWSSRRPWSESGRGGIHTVLWIRSRQPSHHRPERECLHSRRPVPDDAA